MTSQKTVAMNSKKGEVAIRSPESSTSLGINLCIVCEERDNYENLIAAGTKHVSSSKVNTFHVDSFTCKLGDMALNLNGQKLLAKLTMGDVISNELFYHKGCYIYYLNRYRSAVNTAKTQH